MKFNIATIKICIDIHEYSAHNMIIESKGVPKNANPLALFLLFPLIDRSKGVSP